MTDTTCEPICIDEFVSVLAEFEPSHRWNGFIAAPRLDAWAVEFVLSAIEADAGENDVAISHEWIDGGILRLTEEYEPGEASGRQVVLHHADADGFYSLGAYGWVWSEDPTPETAENNGVPFGHAHDSTHRAYTADYCPICGTARKIGV